LLRGQSPCGCWWAFCGNGKIRLGARQRELEINDAGCVCR
jgi:hypothetical protein